MKATIVLKRGNMAGLAKHLAKKYGGDPDFFTKVMGDEALADYDEETKKAIAARAHKMVTGHWPAQDEDRKKKKQVSWKGGPGSGFEGHAGIPGHLGGSQASTGGGQSNVYQPTRIPTFSEIERKFPANKGGLAYIVHGTFQNMRKGLNPVRAFLKAAENENYYGMRKDIVKDRKAARKVLAYYGVKISDEEDTKAFSDVESE